MGRKFEKETPAGIKVRHWSSGKTSLMIQFNYRGVVCRETLSMEATASNIRYAEQLRHAILNDIMRNTFNYADHFPDSKHALRFGHVSSRIAIAELLDAYLEEMKNSVEKSTYTRTIKVCNTHLYPNFGHIAIQDLKAAAVRKWIKSLTCKRKTISNILIPLRAVVEQALMDEYINENPFDKVILPKLLRKDALQSNYVIDPFDREEIKLILAKAEVQIKNLYQFAFFTGLRPSELIGLRWGDVDWVHNSIRIEETIVDKAKKGPKTRSGYRDVMLLTPALAALKAQKAYTFLLDKRVFHNPRKDQAWETSQQLRRTAWQPLLKRAGIRYRNPYQTRHTYASMMISQGENVMWLSRQMGHADAEVTLRKYARWLPDTNVHGGYKTHVNWDGYLDGTIENEQEKNTVVLLHDKDKK